MKSFVGRSAVQDLKLALGQYALYVGILEITEPERHLYLAVSERAYSEVLSKKAAQMLIKRFNVAIVVVDIDEEDVLKWID